MYIEVAVDFGDNTLVNDTKRCSTLSDVSSYLETIPNMLGFIATQKATITLKYVSEKTLGDPLPGFPA